MLNSNAQVNRTLIGNDIHINLNLVELEEVLSNLQTQIDQLENIASVSGGTADLTALWEAVNANSAKTGITEAQANAITANTDKNTYPLVDATKLADVAEGATANDTDANLKNRSNHTGSQIANTISDFDTEVTSNLAVAANTANSVPGLGTYLAVDANENEIQISGANLLVNNGEGTTDGAVNGVGNIIIGYDENSGTDDLSEDWDSKTGSHNLVVGMNHTYSSFGGLVAGHDNAISSGSASVLGGEANSASGWASTIPGGLLNKATSNHTTTSGGEGNLSSGYASVVAGGKKNVASGDYSSIAGGFNNTASGDNASISGGADNTASGLFASISGRSRNTASGDSSSVSGGKVNTASGLNSSILGGELNEASQTLATVSGGLLNKADGVHASILGGQENEATGTGSSVSGGWRNIASSNLTSVLGGELNEASWTLATVSGGFKNKASFVHASILGGQENEATGAQSSVSGGYMNIASGAQSSVSGGYMNIASGHVSSVSGGADNVANQYLTSVIGDYDNSYMGNLAGADDIYAVVGTYMLAGCTDSAAENYNEFAEYDDGSCYVCSTIGALTFITDDNSACGGLGGSINISVEVDEPATTTYQVNWEGPDDFTSTEEQISNLNYGQYTVTVTDSNNCIATTVFEVNQEICSGSQ